MKRPLVLVMLAGALLAVGDAASADVVVRLKSGSELYTKHTWTENGLIKFEHRGGVVGFPESAVESVKEADVHAPIVRASHPTKAAVPATAPASEASEATGDAVQPATESDDAANPGDGAKVSAAVVDPRVPEVKNEDLQTRMERLDELSVKVHRELSVARSRGDPLEVVQALEAKIDEINKQRSTTGKAIGSLH